MITEARGIGYADQLLTWLEAPRPPGDDAAHLRGGSVAERCRRIQDRRRSRSGTPRIGGAAPFGPGDQLLRSIQGSPQGVR